MMQNLCYEICWGVKSWLFSPLPDKVGERTEAKYSTQFNPVWIMYILKVITLIQIRIIKFHYGIFIA